jgi:hypothetical protein
MHSGSLQHDIAHSSIDSDDDEDDGVSPMVSIVAVSPPWFLRLGTSSDRQSPRIVSSAFQGWDGQDGTSRPRRMRHSAMRNDDDDDDDEYRSSFWNGSNEFRHIARYDSMTRAQHGAMMLFDIIRPPPTRRRPPVPTPTLPRPKFLIGGIVRIL